MLKHKTSEKTEQQYTDCQGEKVGNRTINIIYYDIEKEKMLRTDKKKGKEK